MLFSLERDRAAARLSGATRVFTFGEDTHSLRLASELADLRSGYANRILWLATEPNPNPVVAAPDNPVQAGRSHKRSLYPIKSQSPEGFPSGLSGAATRIRTGDLILTKDVLYQLSHSSIPQGCLLVTQTIISNISQFVNTFYKKTKKYFFTYFSAITLSMHPLISDVITRYPS